MTAPTIGRSGLRAAVAATALALAGGMVAATPAVADPGLSSQGERLPVGTPAVDPTEQAGLAAGALVGRPARDARIELGSADSLTFTGKGYGHGIGMSQYGAAGAARRGKDARQIVRYYYPGTTLGRFDRDIRVQLSADTTADVIVRPARKLRVRDLGRDRTFTLPTGRRIKAWRIAPSGRNRSTSVVQLFRRGAWHNQPLGGRTFLRGDGQFRAHEPLRLVLPDGSEPRYRGALRSASPSPSSTDRDTVNVLPMQRYLFGVVPDEMPASWHRHALRAQSIAARTYAAYLMVFEDHGHYDTCDTTSCQVYGGYGAEHPRTNTAVQATKGVVVRADGRPAFTQFSASSGGRTARGSRAYLTVKADRFDDWGGNPWRPWKQRVSRSTLESAYPGVGRLRSMRVASRTGGGSWGGRAVIVELRGSGGTVRTSGDSMRFTLGLPSTWFAFSR